MAAKWQRTNFPGVRFREHKTRKHGIKKDQYFSIYYRLDGKIKEEAIGWLSSGWTAKKASEILSNLRQAHRTGEGPQTLEDMRAIETEKRDSKRKQVEQHSKDRTNIHDYFYNIYYPQIQKEKKSKTAGREESLFRTWVDKKLGEKCFKQILKADIEDIFYKIVESGRSIRTAEYCLTTLKQIWREAHSSGYAEPMPLISKIIKKRLSSNDNQRLRYLSHAEADLLLNELRTVSETVFEQASISLHCGLRAGEVLSLTWGCVNIEKSELLIINAKGKDRTVYMTQAVKDILAFKKPGKPLDLVFTGRNGQSNQISQTFRQVAEKIFNKGVTDRRLRVTFHSLRHTCASWMVMQGISLYLVQKVLGHSTIQVTERYSHLAPDQLALAAATFNQKKTTPEEKIAKLEAELEAEREKLKNQNDNIIPFQKLA